MKKSIIFICIFIFLIITADIYAEEKKEQIKFEFTEYTSAFVPTMSSVSFNIPLDVISPLPIAKRFNFDIWYLVYSPYLVPVPFTEIGLEVYFSPVMKEKFKLDLGVGTGFEFFDGNFSLPLITSFDLKFRLPMHLWLGFSSDLLIWGEGMGLEAFIPLHFIPEGHWYGGIEPGVAVYLAGSVVVINMKNAVFIGYRL